MIRRRFGFFSAVSFLLLLATLGVGVWSDYAADRPHTVSQLIPDGYLLGRGVRILADHDEISLYNQSLPYHGSVIGVASVRAPSRWPREVAFDFPGVYFRHFTWPGAFPGGTYWTLTGLDRVAIGPHGLRPARVGRPAHSPRQALQRRPLPGLRLRPSRQH